MLYCVALIVFVHVLHYPSLPIQCDQVSALEAFHRQVFEPPTKIGIIGSGCSVSTEPTASISHYYNLVQVRIYMYMYTYIHMYTCICIHGISHGNVIVYSSLGTQAFPATYRHVINCVCVNALKTQLRAINYAHVRCGEAWVLTG